MASHISHLTSHISAKTYAIIVAGGTGTRMQSHKPKQFMLLNRLPVMMHTIKAFAANIYKPVIIIVLPQQFHEKWKLLCLKYSFNIPHQLVAGGSTRFASVKNALDMINEDDALVAVQDAVRPLIMQEIISNSFTVAAQQGNAVTAVQSRDTVRELNDGGSKHLDRNKIYMVQTPQTFKSSILKKAYQQLFDDKFTDDASVVESLGETINLIEGSHSNIKITYPEDIAMAEAVQKKAARLTGSFVIVKSQNSLSPAYHT